MAFANEIILPMSAHPPSSATSSIGRAQWLALLAALLGWMFDGMEMGVFSMVGRSALEDLLPRSLETPPTPEHLKQLVGNWFGVIVACFLVGAATGGVLFGWLGDRIGRVRAMTLSVLTYALVTGLCGFAQSAWQLGALRFIAALGMGGEWSLGVALVMEVWPNRSRAFMAGLIGASANVGYLLVGIIGLSLAATLGHVASGLSSLGLSPETVEALTRNNGWRLMMLSGAFPATLTFLIRAFVPESKRWEAERDAGCTSHWATVDLLGVLIGATGPGLIIYLYAIPDVDFLVRIAGIVFGLTLAILGYLYPVKRYLQRLGAADLTAEQVWWPTVRRMLLAAGLGGVALMGSWGATQWAPFWAGQLPGHAANAKEWTQIWVAAGAIVGTFLAGFAGDWFGRRPTYAFLCITSIAAVFWLYQGRDAYDDSYLVASFTAGVFTAAFFGWLPLYLPELFRTQVRATGQGFGYNFGRILAAVGALQAGSLATQHIPFFGHQLHACAAMSLTYLVGLVLIWFGPETRGKQLPE